MDSFITYIKNCIQPKNTTEFCISDRFSMETLQKMEQDAILIIPSPITISFQIDNILIGNYTFIRKNIPKEIEWLNEDGSFSFTKENNPIYRRLLPPPIETVDHIFLISSIIQLTSQGSKNYIEYGVRSGICVEAISKLVHTAYGVDICHYEPLNKNIIMNIMTTDTFSETVLPSISFDYAFIDADHTSSQVLKDFDSLFSKINKGGYIFLHDTYPCDEFLLQKDYCNDCYKSPILIRNKYKEISMITLPLNPGFTIIKKI
jgi:hypothetical protein